jgi:predicted RNase H-like nuclease (RuvC/YqgF family)
LCKKARPCGSPLHEPLSEAYKQRIKDEKELSLRRKKLIDAKKQLSELESTVKTLEEKLKDSDMP